MNSKYVILIILCSMFFLGCSKTDSAVDYSITSIRVECLDRVCDRIFFEDKKSIKIVEDAIKYAVKMEGEVKFTPEYTLTITSADNLEKTYYCALGNNESTKGLLVDDSNSSQAYEIPVKYANILRELIHE